MKPDHEIGKALNLLIHDLRAPLGVAHGYIRLITEGRLTSPDEQHGVLLQSLEALGRISRMCNDASAYLAAHELDAPRPSAVSIVAAVLATRVAGALQSRGVACVVQKLSEQAVRAQHTDTLSSAIATILGSVQRPSRPSIDISSLAASFQADATHLYCLAGTDIQRTALMTGERSEFDPWRGGHGLALPLACLQVTQADGHVWTTDTARPGVGISLPLEGSP
jgi:hypothetical protein